MSKVKGKIPQKARQVVEAAKRLFLEKGYMTVSMDAIAQEAGVTKQTVYRYFSGKETLFEAILKSLAVEADWKGFGCLNNSDTASALGDFARRFLRFHMNVDHIAAVRLIISEGQKAPEISRVFFKTGQVKTVKKLAAFLAERFKTVDDSYGAAECFLGMLLSIRMPVLLGIKPIPTEWDLDAFSEKTARFFLKCMMASAGKPMN
jgi:TetR/AcrR family transcriptional repressor of mexJK operon